MSHDAPTEHPTASEEEAPQRPDDRTGGAGPIDTHAIALKLADVLIDNKAADPVLLSVGDLVSYADYLLLVTATSRPHVHALADELRKAGRELGIPLISTEGVDSGSWALIDFGDVVVHLFQQAERGYYDLEDMWVEAERVEIPGAEHAASMHTFAI
jgi:ribosome-associated protein